MKILVFGDSITEGCFEIFMGEGRILAKKDPENAYGPVLVKMLRDAYPGQDFELINAGVSGNNTRQALARFESDVLNREPDLVIICFGLNDACGNDFEMYVSRLDTMFGELNKRGIPTIFMTPNDYCAYVREDTAQEFKDFAGRCAKARAEGRLTLFLDAAVAKAREHGVYVADAYGEWKKLERYGIDTTMLLCNCINHPSREMHRLFADVLFECIEKNGIIKSE